MKRTPNKPRRLVESGGLRPEYRFDYAKGRPNRFAAGMRGDTVAVVLDPDVAEVFGSADSVNQLLRSVIAALPRADHTRRNGPR